MIFLDVKYMQYEEIVDEAEIFLSKHNIDKVPLPIEEIIEFEYDIDIISIVEHTDFCIFSRCCALVWFSLGKIALELHKIPGILR